VGVTGARHAVLELNVQLGQLVFLNARGLHQILDGGRVNHVSHVEALDGLILGGAAKAVIATDRVNMSASVLGSSVISSLNSLEREGVMSKKKHTEKKNKKKKKREKKKTKRQTKAKNILPRSFIFISSISSTHSHQIQSVRMSCNLFFSFFFFFFFLFFFPIQALEGAV
jgi:hypothetical protein